jgi:hypothetical protein
VTVWKSKLLKKMGSAKREHRYVINSLWHVDPLMSRSVTHLQRASSKNKSLNSIWVSALATLACCS